MDAISGLMHLQALALVLDKIAGWVAAMNKFLILSCIQLLDVTSCKFNTAMDDEEQKEVWGEFIDQLEEVGVRLEDQEGQIL